MQITLTELARRHGVSRQAAHKWLQRAGVTPMRVAGMMLLSPADCRAILAARRRMGRPTKKTIDTAEPAA